MEVGFYVKSYNISAIDDNQRLSRYLKKVVPLLYPSMMYRYLRLKRIKVNGKKATADTHLKQGDEVRLYIPDDFFSERIPNMSFLEASDELKIVYEDTHIAVINKAEGVLSHTGKQQDNDTLINRFLKYLYEKKEYDPYIESSFTPALCNRLDFGTAGLVIAAKNLAALSEINLMIKNRLIKKKYLAVVTSKPPADGVYTAFHRRNDENNTVLLSDTKTSDAKKISTAIWKIYEENGLFLVQVELITGRKHQIRAHLKHLGCPILGDAVYGETEINRKYMLSHQALVAYAISFELSGHEEDYPTLSFLNNLSVKSDDIEFILQFFNRSLLTLPD